MTIQEFINIYSKEWNINNVCLNCDTIISRPLKNFTDCYLDLGVTGDEELKKVCEEYQEINQKIWEFIHKYNFVFLEK